MHHIFLKNFPKLFFKMGGAPSIFFYKNKSIKNFNKKVSIIKNCLLQKKKKKKICFKKILIKNIFLY
jgi:hypothetical protein